MNALRVMIINMSVVMNDYKCKPNKHQKNMLDIVMTKRIITGTRTKLIQRDLF